ncbi:MAG TPA: hypothetical protein VE781_03395 [Kineosporiaceae bacterium]|nr:hypothetical protein [Kineosporiaceae bacterium]
MSSQPPPERPRPEEWSRPRGTTTPSWDGPTAGATPGTSGLPTGPARSATPRPGAPGTARPGGAGGRRAGAAAGLVVVAVVGAGGGYWLGHQGDQGTAGSPRAAGAVSTQPAGAAPTSAAPSPSASQTPRKQPLTGAGPVDAGGAVAQLKKAGLTVQGTAVEAWGWNDTNGRNLFVTTRTVEKAEGQSLRAGTLRVYHAAGMDDRPRMMLTPLRDPGVVGCDVDFALAFVPDSVTVADTDDDGYAEATVGWAYLCAGDPQPKQVKLALVTKGTYYILRGRGRPVVDPQPPAGITFPKASFTPNLPASRWPAGTYEATVALFRKLFA